MILLLAALSFSSFAASPENPEVKNYQLSIMMYEVMFSDPEANTNTMFNAFFPITTLDDVIELRSSLLNSFGEYRVSAFIDINSYGDEKIKDIPVVSANGNHALLKFSNGGAAKNRSKGEYIDAICKSAMFQRSKNGQIGVVFDNCYQSIEKYKEIIAHDERTEKNNRSFIYMVSDYHFNKNKNFYSQKCGRESSLGACVAAVKSKSVERLNDYHLLSQLR
ncbi:hypothetical protein PCO87_13785 [Pectobacteriaceae bacterium C52]|nr:hypothetical protein PCO87_13785 [Pectobacteriaceae bacterium C52]